MGPGTQQGDRCYQPFLDVRGPRERLPCREIRGVILEEVAPGQTLQDRRDLDIIIFVAVCQALGKRLPLCYCNQSFLRHFGGQVTIRFCQGGQFGICRTGTESERMAVRDGGARVWVPCFSPPGLVWLLQA